MPKTELNGLAAIQARVEANAERRSKDFVLSVFDGQGNHTSHRFANIDEMTSFALGLEDKKGFKIKSFSKDENYWGVEQKYLLNLE